LYPKHELASEQPYTFVAIFARIQKRPRIKGRIILAELRRLRIAIAGAGMTGAYLYRLLRNLKCKVDIFNRNPGTKCGISPCAWGISRGFAGFVQASGLDPEKYLLRHSDYVFMDGIQVRADLSTFDKPVLIKDLLEGAEIIRAPLDVTRYDRIIDATGVSRAFLPELKEDILLPCVQWRIRTEAKLSNQIKLGKIGYAWCFPLSNKEYHIGCGSLLSDPREIMKELGWVERNTLPSKGKVVCACSGKIRIPGPFSSQPFVSHNGEAEVWGVGEAIGCVAPLAGDGVVPGMKSARILLDYWEDPVGYQKAILREFSWMERERVVIDKLRGNLNLGFKDAWVLKRNSRRMGMQVGLKEAILLLKNLR
jgi:flavin-dependent dehydrogenase